MPVDVIVTWGTPASLAAKDATNEIPIVMTSGDPVAVGLVPGLSHPRGNVTGFSTQAADLEGKRLELVGELLDRFSRVVVFSNPTNPYCIVAVKSARLAAAALLARLAAMPLSEADTPLAFEARLADDHALAVLFLDHAQARQFQQQDMPALVRDVLTASGLPAQCLELELTESTIMRNAEEAVSMLNELHALGIGLAIDDFGTGYSSLSYLARLPIQAVKVDQRFVHGLEQNRNDESITQAIIALSHSLGLRVIAEGVETAEQRDLLTLEGCDVVLQGVVAGLPQRNESGLRFRFEVESATLDGQAVDVVFVLLLPASAEQEALAALALVARTLRSPETLARMRAAKSAAELHSVIT